MTDDDILHSTLIPSKQWPRRQSITLTFAFVWIQPLARSNNIPPMTWSSGYSCCLYDLYSLYSGDRGDTIIQVVCRDYE
jgi:hypothetical protein